MVFEEEEGTGDQVVAFDPLSEGGEEVFDAGTGLRKEEFAARIVAVVVMWVTISRMASGPSFQQELLVI